MSLPTGLTDFARIVLGWLADALAAGREAEAQRAAKTLATAGVLLAALHALDNRLRRLFSELNV